MTWCSEKAWEPPPPPPLWANWKQMLGQRGFLLARVYVHEAHSFSPPPRVCPAVAIAVLGVYTAGRESCDRALRPESLWWVSLAPVLVNPRQLEVVALSRWLQWNPCGSDSRPAWVWTSDRTPPWSPAVVSVIWGFVHGSGSRPFMWPRFWACGAFPPTLFLLFLWRPHCSISCVITVESQTHTDNLSRQLSHGIKCLF